MGVLDNIMLWTFWIGLAIVIGIDIVLAIQGRKTFSRRTRSFGMDVPVIAYGLGLLPTHFWFNFPVVGGLGAAIALVLGAGFVLSWEIRTSAPMHPFVAFLIGLPMGAFFFPN